MVVDVITFANLTEDVTIRIYTMAGELVIESDANGDPEWPWDIKNAASRKVASGIYIYYITNSKGEKKTGKFAIIR